MDMRTYRSQVGQLKVRSIHLQDVASGFPKHIHAEAHPMLNKSVQSGILCYYVSQMECTDAEDSYRLVDKMCLEKLPVGLSIVAVTSESRR